MAHSASEQINNLIGEYDFPTSVLEDVNNRVHGNEDNEPYLLQQVRYLQNLVAAGRAPRKTNQEETPNE